MNYQNLVKDFALRTKHNLRALRDIQNSGKEVYEVTQLINSMLGLLIFPKENYFRSIPRKTTEELLSEGWSIPKVVGNFPQVRDLRELIRYLRNAIAHFNIEFYDEGTNKIKGIIVWNTPPGSDIENWRAKMSIKELESITEKFLALITSKNE